MNYRLRDADPVASFPDAAVLAVWLDASPDVEEADLDADRLCQRVRREGCITIVEAFDAE